MKTSTHSGKLLNSVVDKIYNLIFGWIDSLFDDANYETEESTIPKEKVEVPKRSVNKQGEHVNAEDIEVADDAKVIRLLPKEVEERETKEELDEFTIKVVPVVVSKEDNVEQLLVSVVNNTTNPPKESLGKLIPANDESALKEAVEKCKKEVSASCKIGLKKTVTASSSNIQLTNITSTYDLALTIEDVADVLDTEEFQDSVPEGDSVYRIDVDADGYDVNEIENFEFKTSIYSDALDCCIKTMSRISELSWFAKGIDYTNFKSICESLNYHTQYHINALAKLCIIHDVAPTFEAKSSDAASVSDKWASLKDCVNGYIAMLQALSLVATEDEKVMLETWIRELNDIIQYQWKCLQPEIGQI